MRIGLMLLVPVISLLGCADRFARSSISEQQANVDLYECQRENRNFSDGSIVGPHGDFAQEAMIRQCMHARGYTPQ